MSDYIEYMIKSPAAGIKQTNKKRFIKPRPV